MGILLTLMLLWNMIGKILLLPARGVLSPSGSNPDPGALTTTIISSRKRWLSMLIENK